MPPGRRADARFCSQACRQHAFRVRTYATLAADQVGPREFAYADPPYPGFARRYYGCREVDHAALVADLVGGRYCGWALSTSAAALVDVLPLCPRGVHVCAWVKPRGVSRAGRGPQVAWEPLIVWGGRKNVGVRDWLSAHAARGGGDLIGRKPLRFCAWLFALLGMQPGDTLRDLFPGSGVVARAWSELSAAGQADQVEATG